MLTRKVAAYIAGYFDADGCVSISLNGDTMNVKVSISGRNVPLCQRLKTVFGGGIDTNDKEVTSWYAYSDTAREFLFDILSSADYKRPQVEAALVVLDDKQPIEIRLQAALKVCRLNQQNLANPQVTVTMQRIAQALHRRGVEVEL